MHQRGAPPRPGRSERPRATRSFHGAGCRATRGPPPAGDLPGARRSRSPEVDMKSQQCLDHGPPKTSAQQRAPQPVVPRAGLCLPSASDGASPNSIGVHEATVPKTWGCSLRPVSDDITVANLIGQHGVWSASSKAIAPIRYPAIREGLKKVVTFARKHRASVAMSRIGCGLAGGSWEEIEPIIEETLGAQSIPVSVYDLS